jgi:hypothetical protein
LRKAASVAQESPWCHQVTNNDSPIIEAIGTFDLLSQRTSCPE